MQLTLALPGLLAHSPEALATIEVLSHVAARSTVGSNPDLDTAIVNALGMDTAIAPLAALGAGVDVAQRWVIRADPVTMTAGQDAVFLNGRVDDLGADEAAALHHLLSTHFASDGLVFEAPRPDTWFVLSAQPFAIDATPFGAAIGRSLRTRLPVGPDAAVWRRWFTEVQMLLHEHALSMRPQHPVNALWFAGGGSVSVASGHPAIRAFAPDTRDADVVKGLALLAGCVAEPLVPVADIVASAHPLDRLVVMLDRVRGANDLDAIRGDLDAAWLALQRGKLDALILVADDGAARAASWHAARPTWWQRMHHGRARFAVPPADDAA